MSNASPENPREVTPSLWKESTGTTFRSNAVSWAKLGDGRVLLANCSGNGYSHLWNAGTGEPVSLFARHDDQVLSIACAALPTGQLIVATGGKDRTVRIWGGRTGNQLHVLDGHAGSVNSVDWAVLRDGSALLATGGDDATVVVWDGATGIELSRFSVGVDHVHIVHSVSVRALPDGRVWVAALADDDGGARVVHLRDARTGAAVRTLRVPDSHDWDQGWGTVALAVTPDGRALVAANSGGSSRVWDAGSGEQLWVASESDCQAVAWAVAGELVLVSTTGDRIVVTSGVTGREIGAIPVTGDGYFRTMDAVVAPNGDLLVAAAWKRDTPARVWRVPLAVPAGTRPMRPAVLDAAVDQLIDRVGQRFVDHVRSRDRHLILGPGADEDCARLHDFINTHAHDQDDASRELLSDARLRLGLLCLVRFQALVRDRDRAIGELAQAVLCLKFHADDPDPFPSPVDRLLGPNSHHDAQADAAMDFLVAAQQSDDPALLDAGIALLTLAVEATPVVDPEKVTRSTNLCLALQRRFKRDYDVEDLDRAVEAGGIAVGTPGASRVDPVNPGFNLAYALLARFRVRHDPADASRAVVLLDSVATACAPGPNRSSWLDEAAKACMLLYERTDDPAALKGAIDRAERATSSLPEDPAEAGPLLFTLAGALFRRYERTGEVEDLRRAVRTGEHCLDALPGAHPDRPAHLTSVAWFHLRAFSDGIDAEGLRRAGERSEEAVAARPDSPIAVARLVAVLQERYRFKGTAEDLDRAIRLGEGALAAGNTHHELESALAGAYLGRYQHAGVLADLNNAITAWEAVLEEKTAAGSRTRGVASLLGSAYQQRFTVSHNLADLKRAIELGEQTVGPVNRLHPDLGEDCGKLAISYQRAHEVGLGPEYLDRAVELGEMAVAATAPGHPGRAGWLANLAGTYQSRPDLTPEDLDRAVDLAEQAMGEPAATQVSRLAVVGALAAAYRDRAERTGVAPDPQRLNDMVRELAAETAPAERLWGHYAVGALAFAVGEYRTAVEVLDTAVALLPDVLPRGAGWVDQQYRLGTFAGLVGTALAAHCAAGDTVGAVEVVEQGRGVLLAEHANTRTDLTWLERLRPDLADRLRAVRRALNGPALPGVDPTRAWREHDALIAEVRACPGGEDFLRRPRLADLREAVAGGVAVVVNVVGGRGDAVIVRHSGDPLHVPLPYLRAHEVEERAIALTEVSNGTSWADLLRRKRVLPEVLAWLWDAIAEPVLAALPAEPRPRRIWWLPVGYLGVFPLHAAGRPGRPGVLDQAVSSYVPTLRALRDARRRAPAAVRRQLVVALERTPGLPDLPGTAREAVGLGSRGMVLRDREATVDRVMTALPEATWAHFACHAEADLLSPADSSLRLDDGPLRLPTIGGLDLPQAELAYLSACSTAHHGGRHADEVLHVASAFQLAGFRHVIASLWPLDDQVAADAASAFYRDLADIPTTNDAAAALRRVALALRSANPEAPHLWAALVHSGP
ncbi:CHAT domain-containing protein [Saccharothrix saharensis]|uniref:CHAT domain-containing protein n=1 Tax=Saccharothrix saharensis TaxID=571190 RepID=UPI0036A72188